MIQLLSRLTPQQPSRRECSILISYQEKASGSKHLPKVSQPASKWDLESSRLGRGARVLGPLPPPVDLPLSRPWGLSQEADSGRAAGHRVPFLSLTQWTPFPSSSRRCQASPSLPLSCAPHGAPHPSTHTPMHKHTHAIFL